MDVKLSIREDVGMSNPIKQDEMDSLKEEEIWRDRRERMNTALAAARTMRGQDQAEWDAATQRLVDVIRRANVDEFIDTIEMSAERTDLSAIFDVPSLYSLLNVAEDACKCDILRLLLDYAFDPAIAAQDDWGDTPLHKAAKNGEYLSLEKLTCLAGRLPSVEDKNRILRMQNRVGNTVLHEAVINCEVKMVRLLLKEFPELVYLKNAEQKSPLYLVLDTSDNELHEVLFSLAREPSRIQGMPPVHGAVVRRKYELLSWILGKNMKLFAMTDSTGGNIFHFAAYTHWPRVFELLDSKIEHLVKKRDMNGDLPIHIASKRGYVDLIKKLHPLSKLLNGQGQTVLHVAAKYGQASAVRYILRHQDLGKLINERDHDGNTALHLAAMHFQPATLIALVLDERIKPFIQNHECSTVLDVALRRINLECTPLRELMTCHVLASVPVLSEDLYICRPAARDKRNLVALSHEDIPKMGLWRDVINTRLVVAALVTTVTFAAGFAVPGGFDNSESGSKDDQGMAVMLDKGMFRAFAICNTIAMFSSMSAVITLTLAQQSDFAVMATAAAYAVLLMTIALPAMSVAFLTGVTLTVGKLPWLANTVFFLGLIFLLFISASTSIACISLLRGRSRPILRLKCWLILFHIYFWGNRRYILDDPEKDGTASGTSTSRPPDGAGESETKDSVTAKCGGRATSSQSLASTD